MGGLVCAIRKNGILRFKSVPTDPDQVRQFDAQMRELIVAPGYAEAIANETTQGQEVCDMLEKPHFTHADREKLLKLTKYLEYSTPTTP